MSSSDFKLHPEMKLGPISLRVKDLASMLLFYEKELGLTGVRKDGDIVELGPGNGISPLLVLKHDADAEKPPEVAAGLYHYALLAPNRRSLAAAYLSIGNAGVTFDGYADHLVSEALYLNDPEGNGIEIYADRPRSEWKFDEDGQVNMATQPLDIDSLLKEVAGVPPDSLRALPEETRVGHIHLKVTDLQRSIAFYHTVLSLDLMRYYGSAAFLSVGGYHHHIGMNTWESLGGRPVEKNWAGLEHVTITVPHENLDELSTMLADSPIAHHEGEGQLFISDPDEIALIVKPPEPSH
jgi:catechol 2,3-dioxygenase